MIYTDDYIIISPHKSYNATSKVVKISKKNFESFYHGKIVSCLWDNKIQLPIQKIKQDIKVKHQSGDYYFRCLEDSKENYDIFDFYSSIVNYNLKISRHNFLYGDDQNFIKGYLKEYLNKEKCLDHNKTSITHDYSLKFKGEYIPISSLLKNEHDYYVGHRVNTKRLYLDNFQ